MKYWHQFALCLFLITSTKPSSSASILAIWNNLTIWNTLAYSATFNPCPKVWYGVLWMNNLFPTKSLQIIAQEFPLVFPESAFAINWNRKLWDKTSSNAQSWKKWTVTKDTNEIFNPCDSLFSIFHHWFPTCTDLPFNNKNKLFTSSYVFLLSQPA